MVLANIQKRRSIYPPQFNKEAVPKAEISTLLEAANWAPSHYKTEPWRFKVVYSEESRQKFSTFIAETYKDKAPKFSEMKYKKLQGLAMKSAAVIAICMQRDEKKRPPEWEEMAAVSMAVQNLWLQATAINIGGFWSSPGIIIKEMGGFFDLNEGETCLGFFYLGKYDTAIPAGKRDTIEKKVIWM